MPVVNGEQFDVLIACEYSGRVRDAFTKQGIRAISCDTEPTDIPGPHYQGDVRDILFQDWVAIIAFPPCTYLTNVSAVHFYNNRKKENGFNQERFRKMEKAIEFFLTFLNHDAPIIAIENPVMVPWAREKIRQYNQIVNPFDYGHNVQKRTCLWLKGLPPLMSTRRMLDRGEHYISRRGKKNGSYWYQMVTPGKHRSKVRSLTFQGIADAMADQWAPAIKEEINRRKNEYNKSLQRHTRRRL